MTDPSTKTVLIVTCQSLPHPNHPCSGGSLRSHMLGEALRSRGFKVLYSLPQSCVDATLQASDEQSDLSHSADNIGEIVNKCQPDVVLFSNWGLAAKAGDLSVPVIIDMNGSLVLENYYRKHTLLINDALAKLRAMETADLVLAGSDTQKRYLIAWGLMAGLEPDDFSIEVVPFSLSPELPTPAPPDEPVAVMAGYDWPWLDGHWATKIVNDRMKALDKGHLMIYTGVPPYSDVLPGEDSSLNATGNLALADLSRAQLFDPVPFDQLTTVLSQCSFALDVWKNNLEREIAFSSRTVAYLWSGLPVITSSGGDLAQLIAAHKAGWIVTDNDENQLSAIVDELLRDPEKRERYSANARKLVKEQLTWDITIDPVVRFCASPSKRRRRSPLLAKLDERQDLHNQLNRKISELYDEIGEYHCKIEVLGEENRLLAHVHRRPKGPAIWISPKLFWKKARKWIIAWPLLVYLIAITSIGFRLHLLSMWWQRRWR